MFDVSAQPENIVSASDSKLLKSFRLRMNRTLGATRKFDLNIWVKVKRENPVFKNICI